MKTKPSKQVSLTAKVMKDGRVDVFYGLKKLAFILPEIFTEGWAKHKAKASAKTKGYQGLVILSTGSIGLKTMVSPVKGGIQILAVLTPLSTVQVIHIRQVINLAYEEWAGKGFRLGANKGVIPVQPQADNKISEGNSQILELGPHPALGGQVLSIKAPRLTTVLQDNRQWTPFLHAFVTRGEVSNPVWTWKKGVKKEYRLVLKVE